MDKPIDVGLSGRRGSGDGFLTIVLPFLDDCAAGQRCR
jgi:hypothetical protein